MEKERTYICIDLKSFYASVECVARGLDPLNTNLVVADESRTEKTICLAVSPSLKSYGIGGRARLFEVNQRVREVNRERLKKAGQFSGRSSFQNNLERDPSLELDFIIAPPRMNHYMEMSGKIYDIYLKYISSEDIHVYSIDEVFIDATNYLSTYKMSAHELTIVMIRDVLRQTGITATAGIGTNMYLAKIAMDIVAKHVQADADGVRIAELNEMSYRQLLWEHQPLTDFWRVGGGISRRLEKYNIHTMGDLARFSLENDGVLYDEFGVNAELLIDHAWGYESCTMQDIKSYTPQSNSISSGQVLSEPYGYDMGKLIVKEMAELLSLDLVSKGSVTSQLGLAINFDASSITEDYTGKTIMDHYHRLVPKPVHSSINLSRYTSSTTMIMEAIEELYDKIMPKNLLIRAVYVSANNVIPDRPENNQASYEQLDLFTDYESQKTKEELTEKKLEAEKNVQKAILQIKKKYGKNSVLKGMNLVDGAKTKERNKQVGGHKG